MVSVNDQDPQSLQARLQRALADGVFEAIAQLRGAARGQISFKNDHELRACVALARMAGLLMTDLPQAPEPRRPPFHPSLSIQEVQEHLRALLGNDEEAARLASLHVSEA